MAERLALLTLLGLALLTAAAEAEPSSARQEQLLHRLRHDCGSCHGMTLKGGLGPPLLPEVIAERDDEALVHVIRHGVPGTPMPPWAFELSEAEVRWLVRRLREGLADAG